MKKKPAGAARVLGRGVSVAQWINLNPDRFVTRREIGLLFGMLKNAEGRAASRNTWLRRLWRYMTQPIIGRPEAPFPSPSLQVSPPSAGSPPPSASDSGSESAAAAPLPSDSSPPVAPASPAPPG